MSDTRSIIDRLPGISLQELNVRARLLHRTDRKYIVTNDQFAAWMTALEDELQVLEIDQRRAFRYASVYFDTPDRASFMTSARKRRHRFKVRVRSYLDTGQHFVEAKVRDGRSSTVKTRTPCSPSAVRGLDAAAHGFVREQLQRAGTDIDVAKLAPSLETQFTRTTFLVASSGARVTADTDLTFSAPGGPAMAFPELIVLETKSGTQDTAADRALWRLGVRPERVSKFAIGTALMHSELPRNKWHRLMQRHFQTNALVALEDR